jgi:predicted dehydrogenase
MASLRVKLLSAAIRSRYHDGTFRILSEDRNMQPDFRHPDRRSFLRSGATSGAVLAATTLPFTRTLAASETLNIGLIGTGGRCRHLLKYLLTIPNVRVTALADVYEAHREATRAMVDKAEVLRDFRAVLDRKDVDAVLIAAPDHWHVPMTIAACAAGKDVYVEKPLTHDRAEGQAVIDAVKKSGRIVQVGNQQRSMPQFQRGLELVKAGRLGKLHKVHLTWNRNSDRIRKNPLNINPRKVDWKAFLGTAKDQPFDEYRFRNWRWFWDFGGGIFTDLMVHFIDVVHWYLGVDHPERAVSIGNHVYSQGIWETPDTVQTLMQYSGDVQVYFEGTFFNARNGAMLEFMGSDATLYLDRGRLELIPERGKGEPEELILGSGRKGADFYDKPEGELLHLSNWIECIRTRKEPTSPVAAGVGSAGAAHLANEALRTGQTAVWK